MASTHLNTSFLWLIRWRGFLLIRQRISYENFYLIDGRNSACMETIGVIRLLLGPTIRECGDAYRRITCCSIACGEWNGCYVRERYKLIVVIINQMDIFTWWSRMKGIWRWMFHLIFLYPSCLYTRWNIRTNDEALPSIMGEKCL
jgi:hypothetical protein